MTTGIDNPATPSITTEIYVPDQLIAGRFPIVTGQSITLTGGAALPRGSVLGQVTLGAASSAAKSGGNTGTGTFVLDGSTPILANAAVGIYTLRCTVAGTNSATFRLVDPKGTVLGDFAFNGSGATVTVADRIKGVITDGGTDFIVGDGFDVTIAAGSGSYKKSVATAVDGSQNPVAILADAADATGGDVLCAAYLTGEFNSNALTIDASWSIATLTPLLRALSIFLRSVVSAAAPS